MVDFCASAELSSSYTSKVFVPINEKIKLDVSIFHSHNFRVDTASERDHFKLAKTKLFHISIRPQYVAEYVTNAKCERCFEVCGDDRSRGGGAVR